MSKRGPKIRTLANSSPNSGGFDRAVLEPTMKLSLPARREFKRLVAAIVSRGMLGRIDVGHLTLCAALTAELNKHLEDGVNDSNAKIVSQLTSQVRGLKREMALTSLPSRSVVRGNAMSGGSTGYGHWEAKLRGSS